LLITKECVPLTALTSEKKLKSGGKKKAFKFLLKKACQNKKDVYLCTPQLTRGGQKKI